MSLDIDTTKITGVMLTHESEFTEVRDGSVDLGDYEFIRHVGADDEEQRIVPPDDEPGSDRTWIAFANTRGDWIVAPLSSVQAFRTAKGPNAVETYMNALMKERG